MSTARKLKRQKIDKIHPRKLKPRVKPVVPVEMYSKEVCRTLEPMVEDRPKLELVLYDGSTCEGNLMEVIDGEIHLLDQYYHRKKVPAKMVNKYRKIK